MKNKATKERRREREEFVYKYREEIEYLIKSHTKDEISAFVKLVRSQLSYGCKTGAWDIFYSLRRTYNKVFNKTW